MPLLIRKATKSWLLSVAVLGNTRPATVETNTTVKTIFYANDSLNDDSESKI
jgi:hypothetical protein